MKNIFGKMGIGFGVPALLLALIANHASDIYESRDWFVLEYISELTDDGKRSHHSISEFRQDSNSLFIINEKNAIIWCYIFSVFFTVIGVLSTYYSVQLNDDSFFIANSFLFTFLTIFLLNKAISVLFLISFLAYRKLKMKLKPN